MKNEMTDKPNSTSASSPEGSLDRREVVQKLGKFAAYAAPFTLLARTNKAQAATMCGPCATGAAPQARKR